MTKTIDNSGMESGRDYYIRTERHHYMGRFMRGMQDMVVLNHVVWVGSTGRFHRLMQGKYDDKCELEPYPIDREVYIPRQQIQDVTVWPYGIPTEPK